MPLPPGSWRLPPEADPLFVVVLVTTADRAAFLNTNPGSRGDNWVPITRATLFADAASAVAKALQFDAQVGVLYWVDGPHGTRVRTWELVGDG